MNPRQDGEPVLRPTRAIVDLDALVSNYHALERRAPHGAAVIPVVKADAYGHGAVEVARRLVPEGARHFAVAISEEGVELRRAGLPREIGIVVLGWVGEDQIADIQRFALEPNAHSLPLLAELAAFSQSLEPGTRLAIHLKLDTGMTRLGLADEDLGDAIQILSGAKRIEVVGAFQTFASADDPESPAPALQLARFGQMLRALSQAGVRPPMIHAANSGGTLLPRAVDAAPPPTHVRPGWALYAKAPIPGAPPLPDLRDVMTFETVIDQVRRVPRGRAVGYGGTFVAARDSVIAILPVGYADGLFRALSNRGAALFRGRRCPIVGRVSMDLTAIDVTELADAPDSAAPARGERVVLFGSDRNGGRLGVEEVAREAGTMTLEVLSRIGSRVPRVIFENGSPRRVISRFRTVEA